MQAIICDKPGKLELIEKTIPERQAGEALLQIKRVGICGTDLHAYAGRQAYFTYPRILGHELAAEVVEVGNNEQGLKPGDEVVIMPYVNCGKCLACQQGKTNCCAKLQVFGVHIDGGMQTFFTYPASLLMKAAGLTLEEMAIVEPLAIGAHALQRAAIQQGETAVVMGCGPIGLGIISLAKAAGAKVIAMDINDRRLEYCQQHFGVQHLVNPAKQPVEQVLELTNGNLASVVFDATGNKQALESGVQYMAHGGRYVLVGLSKGNLVFNHPAIHAKESSLLCSRNATKNDFEKVIAVLQNGKFPVAAYISRRVSFTAIPDQFESWLQPENQIVKVMTEW